MRLVLGKHSQFLFVLVLIAGILIASRLKSPLTVSPTEASTDAETKLQALPRVMLWAWERPERLDFIDTTRVGVAFLAKTIHLRHGEVTVRPRLQPLVLAKDTKVVAVVRIESDRREHSDLSESQLDHTAREVVLTSQLPDVLAIQIDFDAKASERDFYRLLLSQVRKHLPQSMPLSITALASWCASDNWLSELPIDEAIPMLFRMGIDSRQFKSRMGAGEDPFTNPCSTAAGVSTDELIEPPLRKRLYIFSPNTWTQQSVTSALETYAK